MDAGVSAGIWRYASALPAVEPRYRVTLGEGGTPLILAPRLAGAIGIRTLYLKLESQNPSGSFKDRGTALAVSLALASGATHLVEDSSGNAGASAAAYAARAGLRCTIFVPASAPAAKLRQAAAYGAAVETVPGSREEVTAAARKAAKRKEVYHLDHNASAAFATGTGTIAHELAEAFQRVPSVVMPVGGGSILAGCFDVFRDGDREPPPLFAVQPESCAPIAQAMAAGWTNPVRATPRPTIAGGITIADPPRGELLLRALRATGGGAVAVADEAIMRWGRMLARLEGVYAEPTAAAAVAGLAKLVASRIIPADGGAVVIITGSGLKDEASARAP